MDDDLSQKIMWFKKKEPKSVKGIIEADMGELIHLSINLACALDDNPKGEDVEAIKAEIGERFEEIGYKVSALMG